MKFVIKAKGKFVEYNGEVYREIIDKEAVNTLSEAKAVMRKFLKKYSEYEIEAKECFDGKWKVIAL